ncbi:cyclopropane-fatty-acyl-phospholipid synthase family protein [Streptomyces sp. NBC_00091]|uniref:SAM-dependent methyltransferase n=1 Tax=Streptomyces sp. NBC_00091 TaxID=2975648 RepID=UPI002252C08C|nr:class I SAM-dependent methyltransferase [Streptomyces sp. NBC_00091]MCX5375076.1 class I SAM-dependent methyltransferase [Streptomyces sp. NBC_00091]
MHTPSGTSLPVLPAVPAPFTPAPPSAHAGPGVGVGVAVAHGGSALLPPAGFLPGLESAAPADEDALWLQDALLGPHSADIVRYLSLARRCGGPVLDLGCGAGRLAVPFARHGFHVEAVDRDAAGLERLRAWGRRIGPQVSGRLVTTRADLAELRLRGSYRLALLAGTMIAAVPPHARPGLLREIAGHLEPGGVLALDYTAHRLRGLSQEPRRTWAFQVPRFDGVEEWTVARQVFDLDDMSEHITYHSVRTGKLSTGRVTRTTHKWIIDPERLAAELGAAGLRVERRRGHRLDERTESVLLICRAGD